MNHKRHIHTATTEELLLNEHMMYGSSRLGTYATNEFINDTLPTEMNLRANQRFELTDHLGTVRAVVTGEKTNGEANILALTDYYPFGMDMPGRVFTGENYRFGYQGSERDRELMGGNAYTTFFRQLDPRLGRWMSPDPKVFPWQSPYVSMDNNPIDLTDRFGGETDHEPKTKEHNVQKGDNLFRIGQNNGGVTPQEIRDANPQIDWTKRGTKQNIIYPGENLNIPIKTSPAEIVNSDVVELVNEDLIEKFNSYYSTKIDATENSVDLNWSRNNCIFVQIERAILVGGGLSIVGAGPGGSSLWLKVGENEPILGSNHWYQISGPEANYGVPQIEGQGVILSGYMILPETERYADIAKYLKESITDSWVAGVGTPFDIASVDFAEITMTYNGKPFIKLTGVGGSLGGVVNPLPVTLSKTYQNTCRVKQLKAYSNEDTTRVDKYFDSLGTPELLKMIE